MATRESVIARLEAAKAAKATEPRLVATEESASAADEAADSLTFAKEPEYVDPVGVTAGRPEGRRNWQCSELEAALQSNSSPSEAQQVPEAAPASQPEAAAVAAGVSGWRGGFDRLKSRAAAAKQSMAENFSAMKVASAAKSAELMDAAAVAKAKAAVKAGEAAASFKVQAAAAAVSAKAKAKEASAAAAEARVAVKEKAAPVVAAAKVRLAEAADVVKAKAASARSSAAESFDSLAAAIRGPASAKGAALNDDPQDAFNSDAFGEIPNARAAELPMAQPDGPVPIVPLGSTFSVVSIDAATHHQAESISAESLPVSHDEAASAPVAPDSSLIDISLEPSRGNTPPARHASIDESSQGVNGGKSEGEEF